jgi:superfamily II DNA or RNA helicase
VNGQLFNTEANYDSVVFPTPRDFQVTAHEKLRNGLRAGHRKQLLVAPTGSG